MWGFGFLKDSCCKFFSFSRNTKIYHLPPLNPSNPPSPPKSLIFKLYQLLVLEIRYPQPLPPLPFAAEFSPNKRGNVKIAYKGERRGCQISRNYGKVVWWWSLFVLAFGSEIIGRIWWIFVAKRRMTVGSKCLRLVGLGFENEESFG